MEELMVIGEICTREVVFAHPGTPLLEAARLMRDHHVGSLVIVDENDPDKAPVGILTDRDLVVAVLAAALDYRTLDIKDVVTGELLTVREQDSPLDALSIMRQRGVRRMPVVNAMGGLAGIISIDDVVSLFI
jgi:CBS domain-containing protein